MDLRKIIPLSVGFSVAAIVGCTTPLKTETIPHQEPKIKAAGAAPEPPSPIPEDLTVKFMKLLTGDGLTTTAAAPGEAAKLTAAWRNKVVFAPDTTRGGQPMPSLVVRLWIFGPDEGTPVGPDGELVVALWDNTPKVTGGAPKLNELWHIDRETAKKFRKADAIGDGYTLLLPWSNYGVDIKQINLVVRYNGADGRCLASAPETLTVDHSATLQKAQERLGITKPQELFDEGTAKPALRPWSEADGTKK